ncbi:putative heat shock trehalose synthase [Aspergillus homomorphus CBS 101889]|uniref:Trehalose synthase N-terminal domain-containing protein n=1 Tax=Aspergillus homomorphus (strain CBS 101889) TaxID=1450537 RepID=A0A395IB82_ASPHC|nr:hypothetical protein BO97DRAFT_467041 [Aspergillus homomorphus CBS 101889]RAL17482.1 hypothetical protein BO97DRAFT_467041 [Aspergillus homomorphus CBS 101889]
MSRTTESSSEKLLAHLRRYGEKHREKFVAVGLPEGLVRMCPCLCSRLWRELDTLPLVPEYKSHTRQPDEAGDLSIFASWKRKTPDEQADSMARKCLRAFGVGHLIHNQIYANGMVDVDKSFRIRFAEEDDYQRTVSAELWERAKGFAEDLVERKVKIAFFSMTCQGKPDVHTRHALLRLSHILGVDMKWYVPKPRPNTLQVIRKMEDIMEGLAGTDVHLDMEDQLQILEFAYENASRYWLQENGPLRARQQGGADVVIIDSAPLLTLALLAKQHDHDRPVIFENRLHAPPDILEHITRPQARAWQFVQTRLQHVDTLITPLPRAFTPSIMPEERVGRISTSTDQLDGLNKHLTDADLTFYGQEFNSLCRTFRTPVIKYPNEQYILSLSQLRPGDGSLVLLDAYDEFCTICTQQSPDLPLPKLLICHHGPSRSPESDPLYDRLHTHIDTTLKKQFAAQVCVVQIGPQDQMWNTLLSNARAVVQLSVCQGIPEVLLWALQKQRPVITTTEGGRLMALEEEEIRKNLFVVDGLDLDTIVQHLYRLFTDKGVHAQANLSRGLPDCLTTVGNAACWFYLASQVSRGLDYRPNGEDIARLARLVE